MDRDNWKEKKIRDKEQEWKVNKEEENRSRLHRSTKRIKHSKALHGQRKSCVLCQQRLKEGWRSLRVLWFSQKEVERRYFPLLWLCILLICRVGSEQKIRPFLQNYPEDKKGVTFLSSYRISFTEHSFNYFILKHKILFGEDKLACQNHHQCRFWMLILFIWRDLSAWKQNI